MFRVLSDSAIYEFENEPPSSVESLAQRYELLQRRGSPDGTEKWLNWVIRLPGGNLAGYVQATVLGSGASYIAYVLNSRHWRQGIGRSAVEALLEELRTAYGVHTFVAVLKAKNFRSQALLRSMGFAVGTAEQYLLYRDGPDELVMVKKVAASENAA